jgi:hypothetical protein
MKTKLIDQRGVETEYGLPVQTQNKLHDRGVFAPRVRIGHKWYYRRELLERWLDEHTVATTPEGPEPVEVPADQADEFCQAGEAKARVDAAVGDDAS